MAFHSTVACHTRRDNRADAADDDDGDEDNENDEDDEDDEHDRDGQLSCIVAETGPILVTDLRRLALVPRTLVEV